MTGAMGIPADAGPVRSDLIGLDIVVATPRAADGEMLLRELQRTRARLRHIWPPEEPLPTDTDVLFCEIEPATLAAIPWLPGEPRAALVAIAGPASTLDTILGCAPDAVLHRPFTRQMVLVSLLLARSHFAYAERLRHRIQKLDEAARTIRNVERAKTILMRARALREEEAYSLIRSQAMMRRISIATLAAAIIDTGDMLG